MGYTKILVYGNIHEMYQYSKPLHIKQQQNHVKLLKLQCPTSTQGINKKSNTPIQQKRTATYTRRNSSKTRTLKNFFRLCHHNNYHAQTIHFLTLTFDYDVTYQKACRHLSHFMERIAKTSKPVSISYISVPELQKKGRLHFHLLVYNLPPKISGTPIYIRTYIKKSKTYEYLPTTTERFTRNLQRQWRYGYLDIMPTTYTSRGLAGYMAKYMAKAFDNSLIKCKRLYNCSRNIKKISSYGSNSLASYHDMIIPTVNLLEQTEITYNAHYLGQCKLLRVTTIKQ